MSEQKELPPAKRLSRRAFLGLALLAGAGATAVGLEKATQPVGAAHFVHWVLRGQSQRLARHPAVVALAECHSYGPEVLDCLSDLWRQAGMPDVTGKRVLVKPNLIDAIGDRPITTAPPVVGAVLDLLETLGAGQVVVGDGSGFRREASPILEDSGLASVLARRHTPFIDLNYDDPRPVRVRDGFFTSLRELWLPRHVREADLIVSVPKLKTHHWAGVSLSLKNLFGIVPGVRYGWPKNVLHVNGIAPSILGLHQMVPPVLAVVDGVIGMEGDGPLYGEPVKHGLLAVGGDPVAVDITCAELMGFTSDEIDYLWLAKLAGVGQSRNVEVRSTSSERLQRQYAPAPSG